jgi:hypothetical protein
MKKRSRRENPASLAAKMLRKIAPRQSAALQSIADEIEHLESGEPAHITFVWDLPHAARDCKTEEKLENYGSVSYRWPKCTAQNCVHHGMPAPATDTKKSLEQIEAKIEKAKKESHARQIK